MNYIKINKLSDLKEVIDTSIYISRSSLIDEEIYHNMWGLTFSDKLIQKIKLQDLIEFLSLLLKKRTQQVLEKEYSIPVIFYLWYDQQASQLRFNIISGDNTALPFGCKLNITNSPELILEKFYTTELKFIIEGDVIEYFEPGKAPNDDDDYENFVLDVYTLVINEPTH